MNKLSIGQWLSIAFGTLLLVLFIPFFANGARSQQGPLGSLSAAGTVYVNGNPAASESTIFPNDVVRTGNDGTATFTLSGKGSFKLATDTQLAFSGQQYIAELQSGTVVMDSFGGTTDMSMRVGPYILAPVIAAATSSSKVTKSADASFTVVCLDGSVGLVPIQGAVGRVLRANQSVAISSQGELGTTQDISSAVSSSSAPSNVPHTQTSHKTWIILGAVGGAAAIGGAVAAAGHAGSSSQAVSPSSP
jgi:hypothetical protein